MHQSLRIAFLLVALVCGLKSWSAQSVPYSSELGTLNGISSDWSNSPGNGEKAWSNVPENIDGEATGCTSAVKYVYSETSAADAWLISPEITLEADKDYYLTVWVRTEFSPENFRVTVSQGATPDELRQGSVLIDMNNQTVMGRWRQLRKSFRVDESGNYHFGLNCYSKKNQYTLYVTGFSLVEGDGSHAIEVIPAKDPVVKELPYESAFPGDCDNWSSIRGAFATGQNAWYYEQGENSMAFVAPDELEDNWLVSPGLEFAEAGDYKIAVSAESYGVLDWMLGTDPADPASFTLPLGGTSYPGTTGATLVTVDNPGTYYVGFHAHAENGSSMGYGVYALNVRMIKEWPRPVTDLKTKVDPNGAMSVDLSWTNPSLTLKGEPLAALTKVEIYRDDNLIATLTDARIGEPSTFRDANVDLPGIHKYKVIPYNELGASQEDVRQVESMYVGAGVEAFPYSWETGYDFDNYEALSKWVAHNPAGTERREWYIDFGWRYCWASYKLEDKENDDYLATPYVALEKGYYKITFEVNDRNACYDFGYVTDRADLPGTFVSVINFPPNSSNWGNHKNSAIISVPADGNYAMAWHHVPGSAAGSRIEIYSISMEKVPALPSIAEELEVQPAEDFSLSANISWRNPSTDNVGNELEAITKVIVLRNSEQIKEYTENLVPGSQMSYQDAEIPASGEYQYTVEVYNENGKSQSLPASTRAFIGKGEATPWEANLQVWTRHNLDNDNCEWRNMDGGGITFYSRWDTSDDWAISPFVYLEADKLYEIEMGLSTTSLYDVMWDLCVSTSTTPASMNRLTMVTIPEEAQQYSHKIHVTTGATSDSYPDAIAIESGNKVFAAHAIGMGTINLHSFAIKEIATDGVEEINGEAIAGIIFRDNTVILPEGTETTRLYDVAGRVVGEFQGVNSLSEDLLPNGVFVIESTGAYGTLRLKAVR